MCVSVTGFSYIPDPMLTWTDHTQTTHTHPVCVEHLYTLHSHAAQHTRWATRTHTHTHTDVHTHRQTDTHTHTHTHTHTVTQTHTTHAHVLFWFCADVLRPLAQIDTFL